MKHRLDSILARPRGRIADDKALQSQHGVPDGVCGVGLEAEKGCSLTSSRKTLEAFSKSLAPSSVRSATISTTETMVDVQAMSEYWARSEQ